MLLELSESLVVKHELIQFPDLRRVFLEWVRETATDTE